MDYDNLVMVNASIIDMIRHAYICHLMPVAKYIYGNERVINLLKVESNILRDWGGIPKGSSRDPSKDGLIVLCDEFYSATLYRHPSMTTKNLSFTLVDLMGPQ